MTEFVLGSPEDRARDEDEMYLDSLNDPVHDYADSFRDEFDEDPVRDDSYDADDRFLDKLIDEELAARSPYRGMTREQREDYDRKFMKNAEAGTFSLGDIFKDAILKKSRGEK